MKICILGKYPPIEGGVSAHTYWLARGLAQRGHEIHVVTNADEVEGAYRLTLEPDDAAWYQPEFPETGGRVRVYNSEPFTPRTMGHIPFANPFVSKLASLATDIVRHHRCQAILSYYYEPYGVAGWLASRWTGCPLIVKHAGSDLERLFRVPDLATTYKEILRSADGVVTQLRLMARFLGMGVDRRRLVPDVPYSLHRDAFNSEVPPMDLTRAAIRAESPRITAQSNIPGPVPVIGAYGKIGVSKGTFDLIRSLGCLAHEGLDFRFAVMIGSTQGQSIAPAIEQAGLQDRTYVLPMMPNWKVPPFLRACTAVCFLERDFPVAIHGPIIPREVFACGACLVLSGEIASKQRYRQKLVSGENLLVVEDPKDDAQLASTLRLVITDAARARAIGEQGGHLSRTLEDSDLFVRGWEELLARFVRAGNCCSSAQPRPAVHPAPPPSFESLMPDLVLFLQRTCAPLLDAFVPSSGLGDQFDAAIEFCDFAALRVDCAALGPQLPKLRAALAYAKERLISAHDHGNDGAIFAVSDRLHGGRVSRESAWDLRPVRGNSLRVVTFDYDVSAVGILSSVGCDVPAGEDSTALEDIERSTTTVLFHRSANLVPCELRIDDATRELVSRCDGGLTTAELVDAMCLYFGAESAHQREEVVGRVCTALDYLYRKGVLVFGEYKLGWGWTGGERGSAENTTLMLR